MVCQRNTPDHHSIDLFRSRRDKYQSKVKWYWVDVQTTGSFEDENEETFTDRTSIQGTAESFDLGLPAVDAPVMGNEPEEVTDLEDDDDTATTTTRRHRVPGKGEVAEEHTLEAGPHL